MSEGRPMGRLYHLSPELEPLFAPAVIARGGLEFRTRRPEPAALGTVAASLVRTAAELERRLTTARLVESLGGLAASWLDRAAPHRTAAERLLPATTGYAPGMVAEALDRLFSALTTAHLAELLRAEVGHLGPPPRLVLTLAAGTVFPPAIVTATAALLLRSPVLVKTASAEPVLAPLWAESLAARDPELARLVAVLSWPRAESGLNAAAFGHADVVVAYGDAATISAVRAALPPGSRLVAHGHKVAAAILSARALAADAPGLARSLAREVALYDQQGCLSPHTVFVEERAAGTAGDFAARLARELKALAAEWPRAPLDATTASALRQFLGAREFAAAPESTVAGSIEAGYAVLSDRGPEFEFSPLGRTVFVKPVAALDQAIAALALVRDHLQAVGLAVSHKDRLALARGLGLYDDVEMNLDWAPRVRLCPVHALQSPPIGWPADGHRVLASLSPRPR